MKPLRPIALSLLIAVAAVLPRPAFAHSPRPRQDAEKSASLWQTHAGVLRGIVKSAGPDSRPVAGATVLVQGTVYGTTTGSDGAFLLKQLPEGNFTLSVSMIGFRRELLPVSLSRGGADSPPLEIVLEPAPVQTAPVVVTANRHEQSSWEVPASVSTVDEPSLAYRNAVTPEDALRYVPGILMTRSQVNVRGSTGYSYGVGTRVLLLVDGQPLLAGDTGEIIWESVPAADIERIEVVKGAASALYGSNALGGVINIITKRAAGDRPETRWRLYGGLYEMPKYEQWRWTAGPRSFGGIVVSRRERIGDWTLALGGSRTLDDGYRRNDFWKRWNLWSRVGWAISPFQSAELSFNALDQRRGSFLYWKDLQHALEPPDGQLADRVRSVRQSSSASYRYIASPALLVTGRLNWFRSRWEDNIANAFSPSGSSSRSDLVGTELQMNYQLPAGHLLTGGVSGAFNAVDADTIFGKHTAAGGALYLQDEILLPDSLRLTLGARGDSWKIEGTDRFSRLNPKAGIVYVPAEATALRASAGSGFRAPSIAETYTTTEAGGLIILPNRALRPERSWSFELGATHSLGETMTADLALFRTELWDLIEPSFAQDGYVHFQNVTRARIRGAELSLHLDLAGKALPVDLGYTYVYPEDVTAGDLLKYRPRHLLVLSARALAGPLTFGADFRSASRVERIDDQLVTSGTVPDGDQRVPVSVVDLHLRADWRFAGLPVTSSLHLNNLLQYYYTDFVGNLGPVRNYVLSLESPLP